MNKKIHTLILSQKAFIDSKDKILSMWVSYEPLRDVLDKHSIDKESFKKEFASGVFDYFMGVISQEIEIGKCPILQNFLIYLKTVEITVEELFTICSHFRRSMIDTSYDLGLNSKELFDEISYIFDKNFSGILNFYTDTIYQKEQEINRTTKLLGEYKKALDESALVSKTDLHGHITYVNENFVKLCGFEEDELIGNKHNIMRHSDMSKEYYKTLWESLKKDGIFKGTIKNRKKSGEYFYIDVTIVKISDPADNSIEYMSIAYDVTKLIDARVEALKAGRAKEYFLSNMSHEIRTPLNAILGFVNLLIDEKISNKHRNYLNIILNSGENLLSIINDILDFSKLRSGEFAIEPRVFSIHDEISHTMELFVASASSKNITITSFIDPKIPSEIYADSLRIKQILSNFLSNAIKFSSSGDVINVEALCEDSILKIFVKDSGIGISKEDIKNIFTAFTQATNKNNQNIEGTGLGLSICYQLASHMGGSVDVSSALGKGSKFSLNVPVEVKSQECKIFDEIGDYASLKIAFLNKDKSMEKYETFLRYLDVFDMDVKLVDNVDEDFDILIFADEDVDKKFKKSIQALEKKFIVIMDKLSDEYDKRANFAPVTFPLYCSKLQTIFSQLVNPKMIPSQTVLKEKRFKGHLLVAEDNETNQQYIKIILEKYGLSFDVANNGAEAFELYKQNSYDLVLMDEQMPIMSGTESLKHILKYEQENAIEHTPVCAITANVIKGAKEKGLSAGYDLFLGKPIVLSELEELFYKYLQESNSISTKIKTTEIAQGKIKGLDIKELKSELMLNDEELLALLGLFLNKIQKTLPELKKAIDTKDYKNIMLLSHSIKGSSANFRIESVQEKTLEMEKMAKAKDSGYDYIGSFERISKKLSEISIS